MSYANPYLELYDLALCWSGYDKCKINFELFGGFIDAYFENMPMSIIDWESIYYSNYRRLNWLEYNIRRALLIECSTTAEQNLGIMQVQETINQMIYYNMVKGEIKNCLMERFTK